MIIRHAEKPETGSDLSPPGFARARAYVDYFKSLTLDSHPVKIDHLFATKESKNSNRPQETLLPLSNELHLKLHTSFGLTDEQHLADKILSSYSNETVLICWHHGAIPDLLKDLGAHPKTILPQGKWPDDVFGWLVVLHYDEHGDISAKVYSEGITPEDAEHPPPVPSE
jgi:broad specificity phosphatase PhoE